MNHEIDEKKKHNHYYTVNVLRDTLIPYVTLQHSVERSFLVQLHQLTRYMDSEETPWHTGTYQRLN